MIEFDDFAPRLVAWQRVHGRHSLPWQGTDENRPCAYHVWLSEVMLQQTQVATVIDYFKRFLEKFPTVQTLAQAPLDDVLALWSGLGYYSRARNLHRAAQMVAQDFQGEFPSDPTLLEALPGVGRSTAAAIAALAYGKQAAILDGNVKRVLARAYAISEINISVSTNILWQYAEKLAPTHDIESYTQGLMDLGATVCTRTKPSCMLCPFERDCLAHQRGEETKFPVKKIKSKTANDDVNEKRRSKHAVLLLLFHEEKLLLERRPASGIWGGLWSAPEYETSQAALAAAASFGAVKRHEIGGITKHSFTHFDLFATPLKADVQSLKPQVAEETQRWVSVAAALEMGIPALLRKWLTTLA